MVSLPLTKQGGLGIFLIITFPSYSMKIKTAPVPYIPVDKIKWDSIYYTITTIMVSTVSSFLYASLSQFFLLLESFYIFKPVIVFSMARYIQLKSLITSHTVFWQMALCSSYHQMLIHFITVYNIPVLYHTLILWMSTNWVANRKNHS